MSHTASLPLAGKPILFSAPMVRAILAGTKTQTRRVVKPQPKHMPILANAYTVGADRAKDGNEWLDADCINPGIPMKTPFVVGMRLWVRETFRSYDLDGTLEGAKKTLRYRADGEEAMIVWKPSIFMPRWASRITLEIESVRVERLQDISEEDAKAEGVESWISTREPSFMRCRGIFNNDYHRRQYEDLWESINGKGSWALNPWVWCLSFRRLAKEPK